MELKRAFSQWLIFRNTVIGRSLGYRLVIWKSLVAGIYESYKIYPATTPIALQHNSFKAVFVDNGLKNSVDIFRRVIGGYLHSTFRAFYVSFSPNSRQINLEWFAPVHCFSLGLGFPLLRRRRMRRPKTAALL